MEITKKKDPYYDLDLYHKLFTKKSIREKKFYNIGAGSFYHPYWTNIDFSSEWYSKAQKNTAFINYNLFSLEKLPLPDNSAELIYSSHLIEHIDDEAAQNMFKEAFRILKSGGVFRLVTPNIDLEYRAYRENDRDFFYWIEQYSDPKNFKRIKLKIPMNEASTAQVFLFHFASHVSEIIDDKTLEKITDEELEKLFSTLSYEGVLNHCVSKCKLELQIKNPGYHMNWWNEKKAFKMLKQAGFNNIFRSGYGQSFSPILRNTTLFDNIHPKISLYIEVIK
jgi:predicted SAM-dependent methyltransferase